MRWIARARWTLAIVALGTVASAQELQSQADFEKDCKARGGEFIGPGVRYGIATMRVPPSCGFGRAKDAGRMCSSADSKTPDDCAKCQYKASCEPAAGDFGPMRCACGSYERVETMREPKAQVQVLPAEAAGELDVQSLGKFADARKGLFLRCYEPGLRRDPSLRGRLKIVFTVQPTGRLTDLEVREIEGLKELDVECVRAAVASWELVAKPPRTVRVQLPLVFSRAQ